MAAAAKVAYARVSSQDQNLDRQLEAFKLIAPDRIFTDKLSGKNIDRPGFQDMMDYVRDGDHLYVASMDRLARNLKDLLEVTESLQKKGVAVPSPYKVGSGLPPLCLHDSLRDSTLTMGCQDG